MKSQCFAVIQKELFDYSWSSGSNTLLGRSIDAKQLVWWTMFCLEALQFVFKATIAILSGPIGVDIQWTWGFV